MITVSNFHYTQPGPDAFFWVGTEMINGGCNDDNIGETAFSLAPGEIGSKYMDYFHLLCVILFSLTRFQLF